MKKKCIGITLTALFIVAAVPITAFAEFPEKAIEFVIPFGAGGACDVEGRILAKEMSKALGVPLVPINKTGAGGAVCYTYVKNAKPDGHTLAWNSTSLLVTTNIGNVPFDYTALDHVGRVHYDSVLVGVNAKSKYKTLKDFVTEAKKNPDTLKIGHAGPGSTTHLAALLFAKTTDVKVIIVPIGVKRRNAAILSGEVDAGTDNLTGMRDLWKAGKFRFLCIFGPERDPAMPNVPTMKELGYNVEFDHFRGMSVPKGTPRPVINKLADAMKKAAMSEAYQKIAKTNGLVVKPSGPGEFEEVLAARNQVVKDLLKSVGLYQSKKSH